VSVAVRRRWRGAPAVAAAVVGFTGGLGAFGPAGPADAHFLGHDAVDGCEIRWEDESRWDTERQAAQRAWESLRADACVDLLPDAWNTNADLQWKDTRRSDVGWIGLYSNQDNADDIFLNAHYMEMESECVRQHVAMHELGHAHGLAHSSNNLYGNIMNNYRIPFCALKAHDIADYEALWGPSELPPRPSPGPPGTHPE